jgi:hypothetical protein
VWGSTEGQKEIQLNGIKKKVNVNLYEGLKRLREEDKEITIWIDALCINQDDDHEKGFQVALMSHIYARATMVVIWLGTDDYEEAEPAFDILRAVADTHDEEGKSWGPVVPQPSTKTKKNRMDALPPIGSDPWVPVLALFTNIWFLRMWVLQEIALARAAIVIWGPFQLDWNIMESAISIIKSEPKLHADLESRALQNAVFMSYMRKIRLYAMESVNPFLHLLDLTRPFDVTEAKDKVYGLLGFPISPPSSSSDSLSRIFIKPDYSSSVATIYTSVALKLISESGNLDVLSFAVHTANEEDEKKEPQKGRYEKKTNEPEKIPSWVADWNIKTIVYPIAAFRPKTQHSTGTHRPLHILSTSAIGTLAVKGLQLDTVSEICAPVPFKNIEELDPEVNRMVRWCLERQTNPTQTTSSPPPPPPFTEATLASVLTGGRQSNSALITDPAQHTLDFMVYFSQALADIGKKECSKREEAEVEVERQNKLIIEPDIASSDSPFAKCFSREVNHLSKTKESNPDAAREAIFKKTCYRSLFTTSSGRLSLGPGAMKKGDVVVALWGAQVPFVLRKDEGGWYAFVGECYVDGYMEGGAVEKVLEDGGVEEVFELR